MMLRRRFDCFLDEDLVSGEGMLCEKYDGPGVGRGDWLFMAVERRDGDISVGAVAWSVWRRVARRYLGRGSDSGLSENGSVSYRSKNTILYK